MIDKAIRHTLCNLRQTPAEVNRHSSNPFD
jgi:hypothetical protein